MGRNKNFRNNKQQRGKNVKKRRTNNSPSPKHLHMPHPRSLYKSSPNIVDLAHKYPEFRRHTFTAENGMTKIDFRCRESLCALTKALVKKDFNMDVNLPHDRIVPVFQMRYSYLLFIEDLLMMWPPETRQGTVYGIDIGSGASVLYSLIAAKKNSWMMLTSEYDDKVYECAKHNIRVNGLESLVTLVKVNDKMFLEGVMDTSVPFYDFCMFSPPFFNNKDAQVSMGKVNGKLLPMSALRGREAESMAAGGEVSLMMNIVKESVRLRNKIKVFSFMAGRMSTIDKIGPELAQLVGDDYLAVQVLVYGPNHTYGVAWTFDKNVKIKNETRVKFHVREPKQPIQFIIRNTSLQDAFSRLISLLERNLVNYKVIESTEIKYCMEICTYYAFWSEKGRAKAKQWERKIISDYGADWRRSRQESSSQGDSLQTFHSGDTLVLQANMDIIRMDISDVSIEVLPTGGSTGWNGGHQMIEYFKNEWYRN